jgi:TonB family protein
VSAYQVVLGLICLGLAASQAPDWTPPRYLGGAVPPAPRLVVGGGEVMLELTVSDAGSVTAVTALRTTAPFAELLQTAASGWRFSPAEEARPGPPTRSNVPPRVTAESKVLLVGMFRPPVLRGPTLGEVPRDVGTPSDDLAFPLTTALPRHPPTSRAPGQVLIEAHVGADGAVKAVKVLQSQPPFDIAALSALEQWTFKPARRAGVAVPSFVYIAFGFPAIVGNAR